jgi:hypothetical protein
MKKSSGRGSIPSRGRRGESTKSTLSTAKARSTSTQRDPRKLKIASLPAKGDNDDRLESPL